MKVAPKIMICRGRDDIFYSSICPLHPLEASSGSTNGKDVGYYGCVALPRLAPFSEARQVRGLTTFPQLRTFCYLRDSEWNRACFLLVKTKDLGRFSSVL